ncbi:excinuclease ABC subunit A [Actibacterium ureilyticum]|uniref:excinuclease ABC subunit A n=1 Tax=Actibacterium ureilyticum TaxID=1590614 RepID=UPI001FE541AE|nr:excinuclease ABC subunit A [Actibacterium ureilyticum]
MIRLKHLTAAALLTLAPAAAMAGAGKSAGHCPPGLAKKSPHCVPPGQAKKHDGRHGYIDDRYTRVRYPGRHGLDPDQTYYRLGDNVVRIDRDTGEILDVIGAIAQVLD